jgi:hypothetical protein
MPPSARRPSGGQSPLVSGSRCYAEPRQIIQSLNGRFQGDLWIADDARDGRGTGSRSARRGCPAMPSGTTLCGLQLHALAYNLASLMRTLALLQEIERWSLTTLREKLV